MILSMNIEILYDEKLVGNEKNFQILEECLQNFNEKISFIHIQVKNKKELTKKIKEILANKEISLLIIYISCHGKNNCLVFNEDETFSITTFLSKCYKNTTSDICLIVDACQMYQIDLPFLMQKNGYKRNKFLSSEIDYKQSHVFTLLPAKYFSYDSQGGSYFTKKIVSFFNQSNTLREISENMKDEIKIFLSHPYETSIPIGNRIFFDGKVRRKNY